MESQLRLSTWPPAGDATKDEELLRQLQTAQRERSEMRGKVDALNDKVSMIMFRRQMLEPTHTAQKSIRDISEIFHWWK